jgi:hypothetical protein
MCRQRAPHGKCFTARRRGRRLITTPYAVAEVTKNLAGFAAPVTADVLLTLDRGDFGRLLGSRFYGLAIMTPGIWLTQERETGRQGAS